jgi:hypothetical protein
VTGFKLQSFGGKAPKVFARLLPNEMAQVATNTRLDSGRLAPWKGNASASITPVASYFITGSTKTLFRYGAGVWIGSNEDLNIIRSPIAEDPHERLYVTGIGGASGYPRMTTASIVGNGTYYKLGLPSPAAFDSVTVVGTSTVTDTETPQTRSYIFTYVSAYGEEGVPSQALVSQVVDVYSDQSVTVDFPVNPSGNQNLIKKRLYRTDSNGVFRRVAEVAINTDTFNDTAADSSLGEEIPTSNFDAPADDVTADHPDGPLLGLVSMPNGILAGFAGQTVSFSEAFQPHAFPSEYRLTMKSDVVAIAPLNTGLLVLTKEKPAVVQGLDPEAMTMVEVDSTLSCVSKRSVVDMGEYVIYASPDGLVRAADNGLNLITESILTRDQWQDLSPSSIVAFQYEGHYVAFYSNGTESKGFIFDPRGGKNSYIKLDFHATAGFNDLENDELYLVIGGAVYKFAQGADLSFTWRTKKFYVDRPINPGVAKVECESYSPAPTMKLYANGVLKHTQTISNGDLFRLPSGYKEHEFEIELSGSVPINQVCVYESAGEIGGQ